ncbi:MAG: Hpt domain-containing protein, partial [Holophagales bacterium]|nr:Hpt domain-containing protein [Holophagales bacterium]
HLDEVIRHWVQDNKQEKLIADSQVNIPPEHEHASTESGDYQSAYNREIAGLDMNVGIQRFGKSSYIEILRSYVTHTPTLLDILKKADSDNLNNYATHVHGIKGSSRGIGAFSVGDAAEALENAAKAGNIDFVNNNNKDFIQMVETLVSDINGFLNDVLPQSNKPKKDKPEREILAKLMTACAKYDMDGVDTTMAEIDAYDYESDDGLICWLRENVSLTNFTQIQEKLLLLTERETL